MEEVDIKVPECELVCENNLKKCSRCDELEERSKKAEGRILELELEIEKKKSEYELLEVKCKELEVQIKSVGVDLMVCRTKNNGIREQKNFVDDKNKVVDLTAEGDQEDIFDLLMVENHVLECEKRKAESEAVVWKEKFEELELWVSQSQVDGSTTTRGGRRLLGDFAKGETRPEVKQLQNIDNLPASGTPYKVSSCSNTPLAGNNGAALKLEDKCPSKVRRNLLFEEERSPGKKIAPSTPGVRKPARIDVINIFDSDDESDTHSAPFSNLNDHGNIFVSTDDVLPTTRDGKEDEVSCQDYEEDTNECKDNIPYISASKRKRAAKIVTSDTESDEDDDIPISKLKKVHFKEAIPGIVNSSVNANDQCPVTRSRRRLVTLRQREEQVKRETGLSNMTNESKYGQGIPTTTDDVDDSEAGQVGSESEDESLNRFIVDSSDVSDADTVPSRSENGSDGDMDYRQILSDIQRSKDRRSKWEFEADMLSAFGKDLELCMRAVCALYRQQTSDEQVSKETKYENNRGFSKFDAARGTDLAVFLTGGDPEGDLKKTKQQLEACGSGSVELCRTLATRYSKQLFQIYKNKEDPLFLPVD